MNPSVKSDYRGMSISTYYSVSTYAGGYPAGFPGFIVASSSPVSSTPVAKSTPVKTRVSTPSPFQTGIVPTCDKFYKVIAGDSCYDIANNNAISLSSFYAWNPAVDTDCSSLQANEYVCIGVKSSSTTVGSSTITRSTTSTVSGITTPSPIQTGMVSNCDALYKFIADDSCYDIANNHAVSLSNFYTWNPAVKTDCSGLQANEYVCVGVESTTTAPLASQCHTPFKQAWFLHMTSFTELLQVIHASISQMNTASQCLLSTPGTQRSRPTAPVCKRTSMFALLWLKWRRLRLHCSKMTL